MGPANERLSLPKNGARNIPWPGARLVALWAWAIWSCAEHWRGNPNYLYGWAVPLLALGFALRRYLQLDSGKSADPSVMSSHPRGCPISAAIVVAVLVFFLEYSREQIWHPEIVLLSICLLAVTSTIALLRF